MSSIFNSLNMVLQIFCTLLKTLSSIKQGKHTIWPQIGESITMRIAAMLQILAIDEWFLARWEEAQRKSTQFERRCKRLAQPTRWMRKTKSIEHRVIKQGINSRSEPGAHDV